MVDWFLIVVSLIAFLLLVVAAVYLLVYYQHPDDNNDAYIPKFVVVFGMVLAGATILLIPLDVANNEGYAGCDGYDTDLCGGLDMVLFWDIFYYLIPIWAFLVLPFTTFYYEADDGMLMAGTSVGAKPNSRICEALKYQLGVVVIAGGVFGLTYLFLSESDIPIREYTVRSPQDGVQYVISPNGQNFTTALLSSMTTQDLRFVSSFVEDSMETLTVRVTPSTFFAALMAFLGWFFFALFGGIGLAATPLDLILAFTNRPRHMDAVEFAEAQSSIQGRVNDLVEIGELLKIERDEKTVKAEEEEGNAIGNFFSPAKRKEKADERKTLLQFKQAVFLLERDVEDFNNSSANYKNYNPLIPYFKLIGGVVALILSILWILHIIFYMLPSGNPVTPFLNTFFQFFDGFFPLLGVICVAAFSLYLLLCAIKGCFKFGLRFLIFTIHPMKPGRTYMSSFLFNVGLILGCVLPVVQFCTDAFADYARHSTVSQVFGVQIQYLQFFRFFWLNNIFTYAFLGMVVLTSIYLGCKPRDTSTSSIELRDRLRSRS